MKRYFAIAVAGSFVILCASCERPLPTGGNGPVTPARAAGSMTAAVQAPWNTMAQMPTARYGLGVGVVNGVIYALGGAVGTSYLNVVESYEPKTNRWTTKASLSNPNWSPGVGVADGVLYVVGGGSPTGVLGTVEAYDVAADVWTAQAPMPTPRVGAGVGVVNGTLYAVGGQDASYAWTGVVEAYDPVTNTWTTKASMPTPRAFLGVGVVNGVLYAVGGINNTTLLNTVEAYDPGTNTWTTKASMPTPRYGLGVGVTGGSLVAVGGQTTTCPTFTATAEAYDPATNVWTTRVPMPTARVSLGVGVVGGVLYAIGGSNGPECVGGVYLSTNEAFTLRPSVAVTPSGAAIVTSGGTQPFAAQFYDANGQPVTGKTFSWASLNPDVATIDPSTGAATAVSSGQVTIAATAEGVTGYGVLTVATQGVTPVSVWAPSVASFSGSYVSPAWGTSATNFYVLNAVPAVSTLVIQYDGARWSQVFSTGTGLSRMWGSSSTDVYAAGDPGVFHFDGSSWSGPVSGVPSSGSGGLWGSAPDNVYVLDHSGTLSHFDGLGWTQTATSMTECNWMWGASASQIFVACNGGRIFRFDGAAWTLMSTPTTTNLGAIWGTSASDVYVVGWYGTLLHYNGTTWNQITVPISSCTNVCSLDFIWGTADDDIYIVGELQGTILHYNGTTFESMASGTTTQLFAVWGTSTGDVYVGGRDFTFLRGIRSPGFTPTGSNVTLTAANPDGTRAHGVTLTFESVTAEGQTTLTTTGSGAPPPTGFQLGDPAVYYDLATTAAFSGTITVCMNYSGIQFTSFPISLFHLENGVWVDRTSSVDATSQVVCAQVTSLSPFLIAADVPPTVGAVTAPVAPVQVNTLIGASASFTDPGIGFGDIHTALISWGDGTSSNGTVSESNGSGLASGSHTYTATGVYTVTFTVTDKYGAANQSSFQFVVVFDPSAGFVTGSGWITSPAGAYFPNPSLTGKATFGFVSRYLKGATVPSGTTQFQFQTASFGFHSTSYDWLVISGAKAQYKGSGTVNGAGNYGFLLTAIDGKASGGGGVDKFRLKVWDKGTGNVIYDNLLGADDAATPPVIGGGDIVIHK